MAWPLAYNIDGPQLMASVPLVAEKPTLVLVHDAFLTPTHMAPLDSSLADLGYRVFSPHLPSTSSTYQTDPITLDVDTITAVARPELRTGRNIIILASGYGAVPATMAAEELNDWSLETPRAGRVIRFLYLAAMLLVEGERVGSALTLPSGSLEIAQDRMIRLKTAAARNMFLPCSATVLASGMAALQLLNSSVLTTPIPSTAWRSIPAIFMICEQDANFKPSAQEEFASRLEAENQHARVIRVPFGHTPYFTQAAHLTSLIDRLSARANS